jgi:predicted Co/Zn/Cd cation transporter (cation efflux family)
VDARNWLIDGMVSLGAATAFIIAYLLQVTQWQHLVAYVDPLLVSVLCAVLLWVPVMTVWENLKEVLMVAPEPEVQSRIRERIADSVADVDTRELYIRMWKVGRIFYVMVHLVVPETHAVERVADLDQVRGRIRDALSGFHPRLAVDTIVTADATYAAGLDG